jgi:hypothetical protein
MGFFVRIEWPKFMFKRPHSSTFESMRKRFVEVYKRIHPIWSTKDRPIKFTRCSTKRNTNAKKQVPCTFCAFYIIQIFQSSQVPSILQPTRENPTHYYISNMSSISEYEDPMSDPQNILNIIERALSQVRGTLQELERALRGVDKTLSIVGVDRNGAITTFRTPPHTFTSPRYDELEITDDDFLGELFEDDGETMKDELVNALTEAKYDSDISMPDSLFEEELDLTGDLEEAVSSLEYPENADEIIAEMTRDMERNPESEGQSIVETKRQVWGGPGAGGVSIGQTTTTESSEGYIYN